MNRVAVLFCFTLLALALARNPLDKYGILYVNEITANSDTGTVQIENSIVENNVLKIDNMFDWNGNGITSESIFFKNGDVIVADDFVVNPPTTFPGQLYANGGIKGDKPNNDFFSFLVEDNTGRTSISGLLSIQGTLSTRNNLFVVEAGSGETTVASAPLNADGGIVVGDDTFVADEDGNLFIDSTLRVSDTIRIGSTATEDRYITREATAAQFGGQTLFSAQDGISSGGDLYIVPGQDLSCANGKECDDGRIFLGENDNSNVRITRPMVSGNAGLTTYNGQSSASGNGGRIVLAAGDSTFHGDGGDIVLVPGLAENGNHGAVYFGSNEGGISDFDLSLQRPEALLQGGDIFVQGQNVQNGRGGNLNLVAGHGSIGAPLRFYPGDASFVEQGLVYLGGEGSANLMIKRSESNSAGGRTLLVGQDAISANGGPLYVQAGSGNGNGGNLYLQPGSRTGVAPGSIYVGELAGSEVSLMRPANLVGGGTALHIDGQQGLSSQGGDLVFAGGDGATVGGSLSVSAGEGAAGGVVGGFRAGGGILLEGGDGQIDGGDIVISSSNGGSVAIATGAGSSGDIYLNAGTGRFLGDIVVGDNSNLIRLSETPIIIDDSYLELQEGSESLVIRADPNNIIQYNGNTILRNTADYPVPEVSVNPISEASDLLLTVTTARLAQLQNSLEILVNNLGQCQHGFFVTFDSNGDPDSCALNV